MKLFVITDIHGFCAEMRQALSDAGFEPGNPEHLLIDCGDNFDRGHRNRAVFDFLLSVPNKILIRGNHEFMLMHLIDTGIICTNHVANGTLITISEFLGESSEEKVRQYFTHLRHREEMSVLYRFCQAMRFYYETEHYIFVHGWLPVLRSAFSVPAAATDWRNAGALEWEDASWGRWHEFWKGSEPIPGKTVVCGHTSVSYGHELFHGKYACYEPFLDRGIAALDGATVRSGIVNVLVVEDELLPEPGARN